MLLGSPLMRVAENFRVQVAFVAEMVIDRGDIGARAPADLQDRAVAVAALGKDFPGRFEQALGCGGGGGFG
jgi:hypothetical protein